jgi:uracil-DNA glycosylase
VAVLYSASYYRPPRRLPRDESTGSEEEPRKRDFLIFTICLVAFAVILFVGSYAAEVLGRGETALSIRLLATLFTTATLGICFTVGIGYLVTSAFLKREFKKKFKKMDEDRQRELRRVMGYPDSDKGAE